MRIIPLVLCLLAAAAAVAADAPVSPDADRVRAHADALIELGDRSPGSPGAVAAADYIQAQLEGFGFDQVLRTASTIPVPVRHRAELTVDGRTIQLAPHLPNMAAMPTTGDEPIEGELVVIEDVETGLEERSLRGAIVVLRGDSDHDWLRLSAMGAAAIIFRNPERIDAIQLGAQYLEASVDLPRFVADIPTDLDGQRATLTSMVRVDNRRAETLLVHIPGQGGGAMPEAVVLTAGYESGGLIAGHDPAATRAWNAGLLLELTRQFKQDGPKRDVLVVFHGARRYAFRGLRTTLGGLMDQRDRRETDELIKWPDAPLADREAVRLTYEIWRAQLVGDDLRAFLELPADQQDEQHLGELLKDLDYLPEDKEMFAGLDYPPASTEVQAGAEGEAAAPTGPSAGTIVRYVIGLILVAIAIAMVVGTVRKAKPHPVLTVCACMIVFFAAKSLLRVETAQTETDTDVETEEVYKLGFRFVSEEAARRADALQPILEDLRLVASITRKEQPTAEDQRKIQELLVRISKLHGAPVTVEQVPEMIQDLGVRHRGWRDIQQKLTKRVLKDEEREKLPDLVRAVLDEEEGEPGNLDRHLLVLGARRDDLMSVIRARTALGISKDAGPDPRLLIAFDLSDGNDRFSSVTHGRLINWKADLRQLNLDLMRTAQRINEEQLDGELAYDPSPYDGGDEPNAWWPGKYLHPAAMLNLHLNSLTLSTVNDQRLKLGTPQDTGANFNQEAFLEQTTGMSLFVREIIGGGLPVSKRLQNVKMRSPTIRVETLSEGSATGTKAYPYPLVNIDFSKNDRGFQRDVLLEDVMWGDAFGELRPAYTPYKIPKVPGGSDYPVRIYGFDHLGQITDVVVSKGQQKAKGIDNSVIKQNDARDIKCQVFRAEASALYGIFDPRLLSPLYEINLLSASRDALPNQSHTELDQGVAALFAPPGIKLRVLAAVGQVGKRMLLLGDHREGTEFAGLEPATLLTSEPRIEDGVILERAAAPTSIAVARDTLQLCKARLDVLQRNGISPENIWTLLAEGQRRLEEADAAMAAGDLTKADGLGQASWAYLSRVYPAVLDTANDVVYGLVVMLLLAIPFALICERLFISSNTIFGKVFGFAGFFAAAFLFFFFFHPAFELATTPVIIFLAFTIIVMSGLVIGIIYQRFEYEMELIRMSGLGMHKADVSRLGTVLATGQLGISNMRRRPLRTFLTAITVVLMTFILLTFASFSSSAGSRKITEPVSPTYNGILMRMPGWMPVQEEALTRVENTWGKDLQVFPRRWLMGQGEVLKFPLTGPEGSSYVEGVIAFDHGDPSQIETALIRPDGERGFGGEGDWIFLPEVVMEQAGLEPGDDMTFQGVPLRVGTIDGDVLAGLSHLGGDPLTPLSATALTPEQLQELKEQAQQAATGEAPPESGNLTHLSTNSVAVLHLAVADRVGADLRSMALIPKVDPLSVTVDEDDEDAALLAERVDVAEVAEDMAQQLAITLRVGDAGETYLLTGVGKLAVAGLSEVLIPLILGGLIIFSTMLGSVAERGKEIFIYASLGLAPIHIAALFLVEASIYAVTGGLGGYMLAQFLVAFLGWMADLGIGVQPDLNYSSFTAVATILLVMATVLLSSLYPAMVASRSAKPGEDTEFKVPEPDGDSMSIDFPFTVAQRDVQGLLAFLKAYFDANTEASTGCFTAAEAATSQADGVFTVTAKTWLAPFDLGISQSFKMDAIQTDVKAIYRIHIQLELLSGQRNAWRRVLFPFLKDLRKQFLVWRTLDDDTTDRYRAEGGDEEAAARLAVKEAERPAKEAKAKAEREAAEKAEAEAKHAADDAAKAAKAEAKAKKDRGEDDTTDDDGAKEGQP